MTELLPHITIETDASPCYSIIWLHGLGADGNDFVPLVQQLPLTQAVRYIFPHAPMLAVTINGGYLMPAWYDLTAAEINTRQDMAGIHASQLEIEKLIAQERQRGIVCGNIYLAGFSQGGALALQVGLRHREKLGGIIALSTYLPLAETLAEEVSEFITDTPIFFAHGSQDSVVPFSLGKSSAQTLTELGCPVQWHEYPIEHTLCIEEINAIASWLAQQMR